MTQTLADDVAANETRLYHLELKTEADENLIALLKRQNEAQAHELHRLRHERDVALRKAKETQGIIETLGSLALSGIKKMLEQEPADLKPEPVIVKGAANRLQQIKPEHDARLPRPMFLDSTGSRA